MIVENDTSNSISLNESQVSQTSQSSHTSQTPSQTKTEPNKNNKHEEKKTQTQQKEPQQQKGAQKTKENKEVDDTHPVSKLDIRVGKVINIFVNKDSEKLYNEEIDIGNGEIRKIASGLKGRVNIEDLKDSLVIVLANLKARTLCGWPSHGMILCASDEKGNIEPIRPAEGSQPGDQVFIGDYPRTPVPELNPKKNPWEAVGGDMTVIESNVATYQKSSIWKTNKGEIRTKSVINAKIS
jgi:methionine--tRNA ligase beta chain